MAKNRVKLVLWAGLTLLLLGGGAWTLAGLGDWAARRQRQANPAAALNLPPDVPDEAQAALVWLPDDADTGREMEPFTRRQIESAYLRAWAQWNAALSGSDPAGLATNFVGPGLTAVTDSVEANASANFQVMQRNQSHALRLHLYAADGSIVSFSDTRTEVEQEIRDGVGNIIMAETFLARYDVVMFLEDGNWRIRHMVRR